MRTVLLLLAMLAAPALVSAQTVWKWVDDNGVTHYSDRPVPGATKMELSAGSRGTSESTPQSPPPSPSLPPPRSNAQQERASAYRRLRITKPAPEESIVNTGGVVQVTVQIDPALRPEHEVHLYLDGQRAQNATGGDSSFVLAEVPRGEHTLTAVITDRRGNRVLESERVTFYVRQASIANPPVGPGLRNPPRQRTGAANKLPSQQPSYADLNGARSAAVDPRTNRPATPKKP